MSRNRHPVHSPPVKPLQGLGTALRELRDRRNLTQGELAKLAKLGPNQVSRYESGKNLSAKSLEALLTALGFDLHDLARAIDAANGRAPASSPGRVRPEWVAAFIQRGVERDSIWGFALGAIDRDDEAAVADLLASCEAAARALAEDAVAEARKIWSSSLDMVAEPTVDYSSKKPRGGKGR